MRLILDLPDDLIAWLDQRAKVLGETRTGYIRRKLMEWRIDSDNIDKIIDSVRLPEESGDWKAKLERELR